MTKPLTINLQINVYPDGSVQVSGAPSSPAAASQASSALSCSAPALSGGSTSTPPSESATSPSVSTNVSSVDGPSESDVRTALLAAVKASDKATAVGTLEKIAGVARVPEVPAEKRAEVIEALNAIVAAAAKDKTEAE